MDCRAHGHAGSEYVIIHATTGSHGDNARLGDLPRDEPSQGGPAGGAQETPIVDPPLDPCLPSQKQVCPFLRAILLCACMHTSRDIESSSGRRSSIIFVRVLPRFPKALIKNSFISSLPDRKRFILSLSVRPSST